MQNYLEEILKRLQDLLVLQTPANGTSPAQLSSDDQLFLYETAGILVVQSQFPGEVCNMWGFISEKLLNVLIKDHLHVVLIYRPGQMEFKETDA